MASSRSNLPANTSSNATYQPRSRTAQPAADASPLNSATSQRYADDEATGEVELNQDGEEGEGGTRGGTGRNVDAFDDERLSELEREVLREWRRLNGNLVEVSCGCVLLCL